MELEFQVVDATTLDLVPLGPRILEECAEDPWLEGRAHYELMENTVELVTGRDSSGAIPQTVDGIRRDMEVSIRRVAGMAAAHGAALVLSGSHPFADPTKQKYTASQRIAKMLDDIGKPMRDLQTYGLHVHVGVPDGDAAVRAMNHLNHYLPHFLALTASSPFWNGEDTRMASYRSPAFETLRLTGPPPIMRTWGDYQRTYRALIAQQRISDGGADDPWKGNKDIHWDVRPSPRFGTIELRICDATPTLREALAIAALTQCLVAESVAAARPRRRLSPLWIKDNKDRAAEKGLDAQIAVPGRADPVPVRDDIRKTVRRLRPTARRLGCAAELECVLDILEHGPGADRQRNVYDTVATGSEKRPRLEPAAAREVVRTLAQELRLDHPIIVGPASRPGHRGRGLG